MSAMTPSQILKTFILMAVCFSANHGAVTACLGLSSSRLGDLTFLDADLGTWQSGCLYVSYTLSAVFGATLIVKRLGARDGIFTGLVIYCVYVACFLVASLVPDTAKWPVAITGALIGGVGGGFLWTAQGAYFGKTAEAYAIAASIPKEEATAYLGGVFAFFYLFEEVALKALSTLITQTLGADWLVVFITYTAISILSAIGLLFVHKFPVEVDEDESKPLCYKVQSATRLLSNDPKMKYMIPLNAVFGFAAAFFTAYVAGQVVSRAELDNYIGAFTAIPAGVAAILSLVTGRVAKYTGKGPVLIGGALAFGALAGMFLIFPEGESWAFLITAFTLMGIGRSTFEGTLRATFADYFSKDLEGAFANIILQSGLSSATAFFLFPHFLCSDDSATFCVEYKDGSKHNVLILELVVIATAVLAILGYLRASALDKKEKEKEALAKEFLDPV